MSEIEALKKSLEFLEGADKEEMQLRISEMEKAANAQARNTSIEPKPREEEKKVKKSIFGSAKTEQKTKKAKDKVVVEVDGLEKKLVQIDTLKAQIDDLKSQLVGITDEVKDISVEKFAKLFKEQQANPNSFIIRSGDGCVMVVPSDKYIKIDSADLERVNYLRSKYGKSIVTEDEKFYLNPKVFERNREAIEELIGNSNMITEDDKENLFIRQIEYGIAKGSIDRLLQLGTNMQQAISDLQPIFSLKNCGGGEAEEGGELEVVQGSWRVLFSGGGAIPEPDDNYENIKTGYSLCCVAPLYNFSEKCPHCKKECSVITEQEATDEMAENANEMFEKGGYLKAQAGQIKDLQKFIPNLKADSVQVIAEGGNDNGETFNGSFLAKVGKVMYRITDGKLVRKF